MASERLRLIDIIANKLAAKVTLSGDEEWHARDGASSKKIGPDAVALYVLGMAGLVGRQLFDAANTEEAQQAFGLEPNVDVMAYTERLDAFRLLLDTLATAGPVDTETDEPTPLSCLLRYGASGVEADTTPYLRTADLSGLVTASTLASEIAALSAAIAAAYLTTGQGDDRYIERGEESGIQSEVYGTDFTADASLGPFFGAARGGGTISGSSSNDAQAGHHGIVKITTAASATIDSGYQIFTGRYAIWMSGGQWHQVRFSLSSVTDVSHRIGFFDAVTMGSPVNGVYFEIVNSTVTAYSTASSTSSSSVYGTGIAINTWYRAVVQFVAGGDLAVLDMYEDDTGTLLFSAAFDTNLPLNAKCGASVLLSATTAVSSKDLALLDSMHYKARA
jgi:hypothetical protein